MKTPLQAFDSTALCHATRSEVTTRPIAGPGATWLPKLTLWLTGLFVLSAALSANAFLTGALINKRQSHTATLLYNGMVLVAGGHTNFTPMTSAELYNPGTGTWTNTGSLGIPRYAHTATLLPNGKVLVTGGYINSLTVTTAAAELYDPATGLWSPTGNLATNRAFHTATLLANGKVLVVGGTDGNLPLTGAELYDPATGTWSATGSLTNARQAHTATRLPDGKVLVAGGTDGFGTFFTSAEVYDPATGTWSGTAALTGGRAYHTATLLPNGKVLAAGGQTTGFSALDTVQLYDSVSGTWTNASPLIYARFAHSASLLPDGVLLFVGGQSTGGGFLTSVEGYDWSKGAPLGTYGLATARAYHTATVLPKGEVVIAGGVTSGNSAVGSAELVGWSSFITWRATRRLAAPRSDHSATLLADGKVLVAGGYYQDQDSNHHMLAEAEIYDAVTGVWITAEAVSFPRYHHTATLLPNGKVLVTGGVYFDAGGNPHGRASAELYDPVAGTWSVTGSLTTERTHHTATLLPNGKVLVAGGVTNYAAPEIIPPSLATTELYDPATGAWTNTGLLGTPRFAHTATLLPNGKVLVAGGYSGPGNPLTVAELYDPETGAWANTGALASPRAFHTATLLPSGKVLVAGSSSPPYSELYDPATGVWSPTSPAGSGFGHSATLLPNGQVLFVGQESITPKAELYDPATGLTSIPAYPAAELREFHTATLLPNGEVLIAGGSKDFGGGVPSHYYDSAELFEFGLGFDDPWQPRITSTAFDPAGRLVLSGTGFRGISSASGGNTQDSATSHPLVQWRRLDSEQTSFLLSDPATPVSATQFTSVPTSALTPGHAWVRVFANGIPSTAFPVLIGFPSIAVELPGGTVIPDGGTRSFTSVLGTPANLSFTIRNMGSANLTGLAISKDGPNAADFTVIASPTLPLLPSGITTFTVQFASASTGAQTASLHVSNNVAGSSPYDLTLTGQPLALSFTHDIDGDGMSDATEVQLAAQGLGFDWQVSQPALVAAYYASANGAGLYTSNQLQALNVNSPLLAKNPTNGLFLLTIGAQKATNLVDFVPFPMTAPQTTINGAGKLEFQFTNSDNAAFFQLEAK